MDILDEIVGNETEEVVLAEEIDHDKLLEDEIRHHLAKKGDKVPRHKCSRCGNDLGSVDRWFNYGIKAVKFGYTMMPQPLCKNCFNEFESFMHAFEVKNEHS